VKISWRTIIGYGLGYRLELPLGAVRIERLRLTCSVRGTSHDFLPVRNAIGGIRDERGVRGDRGVETVIPHRADLDVCTIAVTGDNVPVLSV
jgi:hypothetical protein